MAYRSSAKTQGLGPSLAATMPTIVAGDILIACASTDTAASLTTSGSTWNALNTKTQAAPDGQGYGLWWRQAAGGDTLTVGNGTAQDLTIFVGSWSGRSSSTPGFASTTNNTTSNASVVTLTVTGVTAANGDDIIVIPLLDVTASNVWAFSTPASYTQRHTTTASWSQASFNTQDNVGAGATGNFSITATFAGGNAGWSGYVVNIAAGGDVLMAQAVL